MLDRALLARYLRQRAELGAHELFLEDLTAEQALRLLADDRGTAGDAASLKAPAARSLRRRGAQRPAAGGASPAAGRRGAIKEEPAAPALRLLGEAAAACTRCRLHESRRSVVFGEGSPTADLVVVGEAPGSAEDRTGRPFVGPAGKLLDLLLLSVGFPRERVYICNVLKCRPPQNRNPLPDEVEQCSVFLRGQLDTIAPKVLLAVGKFAAQSLAGSEESIGRLRGRVHSYAGIPLVVSYHPAFLLRSPQWTRTTWEDFQLVRKVLDEQA